MADERTDLIAREAARLMQTGRCDEINSAIRLAAENLGVSNAPHPGHGRVRKHAQAMSMQALGQLEYERIRRQVWEIAAEMMGTLQQAFPHATVLLAGRAAQGLIDAGVTIHVRMYADDSTSRIAEALVEFGYEEPQFQTAQTLHGRLSQIRLVEQGQEVVITRCPAGLRASASKDLFTGRPIDVIDLDGLQARMQSM